jgi:hypothetical protein
MTSDRADVIIANTLLLGGTIHPHPVAWRDLWCVEWDRGSSAYYHSKWRAGSFFLSQCGYHVTPEGNLERLSHDRIA